MTRRLRRAPSPQGAHIVEASCSIMDLASGVSSPQSPRSRYDGWENEIADARRLLPVTSKLKGESSTSSTANVPGDSIATGPRTPIPRSMRPTATDGRKNSERDAEAEHDHPGRERELKRVRRGSLDRLVDRRVIDEGLPELEGHNLVKEGSCTALEGVCPVRVGGRFCLDGCRLNRVVRRSSPDPQV